MGGYLMAIRFNPRTGETQYQDANGNWVNGLPDSTPAPASPLPTLPQLYSNLPSYAKAPGLGGGSSSTGAGAPTPAGVAGSSTPGAASVMIANVNPNLPLQESEWAKNYAAMNNLLRTTPTVVPTGRPIGMTPPPTAVGSMGGGGVAPGVAAQPLGRQFVNSWGATKNKEVRPWNPLPRY